VNPSGCRWIATRRGPTTKGPGPGGSERPDGFRIGESEGTAFGFTVDGEDEGQCGIGPERDGANG